MAENKKWTQVESETVVRMWREGASGKAIAAALGRTYGKVIAYVGYLRRAGVDMPFRKNNLDVGSLNELKS